MESILSDFVIAILASFMTYQFAIKKFKTEKWWELKVVAYQNIIEALHNSKEFTSQHLNAYFEQRDIPEEKSESLKKKAYAATEEIKKAIDTGSFLLSEQAVERLKVFQGETEEAYKPHDWFSYLDYDYAATKKCLIDLLVIAKSDLQNFK